jgi:voltage-gated potassium channel
VSLTNTAAGRFRSLRQALRYYYEGHSLEAQRFRYAMVAFDIATIAFIVATSFVPRTAWIAWVDAVIGIVILAGFAARRIISRNLARDFLQPATWVEMIVIISFLAPLIWEQGGLLRILRTLRLLYTYQIVGQIREDSRFFRRYEDIILSLIHLTVFLFVMTAIVYETQHWSNPHITNYLDALYFTVTTLTTTGFGDVTLPGPMGRLISIAVMIFGVTIFLRLVRALLAPHKIRFTCPACGLQRHDVDAVHCKACGGLLNIPDDDFGG